MMNKRAELGEWSLRLENILKEEGVIDGEGELVAERRSEFPKAVEEAIDGLLDNPAELNGLLKICRAARRGERLSQTVLDAAPLMAREVLLVLDDMRRLR